MTQSKTTTPAADYLAGANLFAQSAEQLSLAATPIVAVLTLGAGPGEIGFLAAAQTLPFFLLSIPFGLLADRMSKKRLMLIAEVIRALALIGLITCVALNAVTLPLLACLGLLGAVGTVAFTVTAPALVPSLVEKNQLTSANSKIELARSIAYAAGPALGGALVSWTGASIAFTVAAMLSISALLLLLKLGDEQPTITTKRNIRQEITEGARFITGHTYLLPILQCSIAWNIAWFVLQAAYVPYAISSLGLSARGVGLSLAAYGVGMVLGALVATKIIKRIKFGTALLLGPAFSVLASAIILLTLWVPSGYMAGLGFFCFGFGPIIWTISSTTLRQTVTPPHMLGRVGSLFLTVNAGIRPLGAALGGLIGSQWGEAACLWASFAAFLVQALVVGLSAVRRLEQLPNPAPV
jgi:predicted MFS family arabinose efflux permease